MQSNCIVALLKSDLTERGNTVVIVHGLILYPSISPTSWLDDLIDSNHDDLRHLLYLSSPYILSFRSLTSFVDFHVASPTPMEQREIKHGIKDEHWPYVRHGPMNKVY